MDFQNSTTYLNLQTALENELSTNGLYDLYRKRAGQEELIEIRNVFDTISRDSEFLAERLRRILNGGDTTTYQNLVDAADRERYAENQIYREFSRIATEEGYDDIASLFNGIANIKLSHNTTLQTFIDNINNNELFCKNREALWICLGCGNILSGECAPDICPICGYPQGYYQVYRFV